MRAWATFLLVACIGCGTVRDGARPRAGQEVDDGTIAASLAELGILYSNISLPDHTYTQVRLEWLLSWRPVVPKKVLDLRTGKPVESRDCDNVADEAKVQAGRLFYLETQEPSFHRIRFQRRNQDQGHVGIVAFGDDDRFYFVDYQDGFRILPLRELLADPDVMLETVKVQ